MKKSLKILLIANLICANGCSSLSPSATGRKDSRPIYGDREKDWSVAIKESYPRWSPPQMSAHRKRVEPKKTGGRHGESAVYPESQEPFVEPKSTLRLMPDGGPVHGYRLPPSDFNEDLPPAILDIDGFQPAPASQFDAVGTAPDTGITDCTIHYTVRKGDTLVGIARKIYGNPAAWRRIYDANRHVIDKPDYITEGILLIVPR